MIFLGTVFILIISLIIGILAHLKSDKSKEDFLLGGSNLRALHIGLSAGATGNSGFIVTVGVALGYLYGLTYCFLPIFWLFGELLFWRFCAQRLRAQSIEEENKTIVGLLTKGISNRFAHIIVALIAVCGLCLYAASQIVVAQKLLNDGMGLRSDIWPLALLGVMTAYVLIGGFRSTVWTDVFQAVVMILLTLICLIFFTFIALTGHTTSLTFSEIRPFQGWPFSAVMAFGITWIIAGAGFGLSQPHVAERYIAARDDLELKKAMWVYNGFLQFTWIGMTLVGVLLRAVHPGAGYDEAILITSIKSDMYSLSLGAVIGAMLCAVISTVDSILHSTGAILTTALIGHGGRRVLYLRLGACVVAVFVGLLFLMREDTIFTMSSLAVAFLTASLAPAVMMRLFMRSTPSVVFGMSIVGALSYIVWYWIGAGDLFAKFFPRFELVPSIVTTFTIMSVVCLFEHLRKQSLCKGKNKKMPNDL